MVSNIRGRDKERKTKAWILYTVDVLSGPSARGVYG